MNTIDIYNKAKEKGFEKTFISEKSLEMNNTNLPSGSILDEEKENLRALLFLTEIQNWLRKEKNIHIYIETTPTFDSIYPSKWKSSIKYCFQPFKWTTGHYYIKESFNDALYQGIEISLTLI